MASVIIISGQLKGECLPLGHRMSIIGRSEAVSLQVLDDLVSRKHLRIKFEADRNEYLAEDMESRHGVFINGKRISEPTRLSDGDELVIGRTSLLFTTRDFDDLESALSHYRKSGERDRITRNQ